MSASSQNMKRLANLGSRTPDQLLSLQALRAIAAIFVTIAHASEEAQHFFGFDPILRTEPFGKGVDLFFVISGFIIYHSSKKLFGTGDAFVTFARNRLIRIVPLYFLFTTLMVLVVYFLPSGVKEARFDLGQIMSSYFFLPYERYDGRIAPILSLGWTLNYEMFFYAIFSLCLFLKGKYVAISAMAAILLLAFLGMFAPGDSFAAIRFWTDGIILEFAMGIGIAYCYERRKGSWRNSLVVPTTIIVAGFVMLYALNLPAKPFDIPRFISAGVPAAMVVGASVLMLPSAVERSIPRWVIALGDSSYSLYLSHKFIQRPIQILFNHSWVGKFSSAGAIYFALAVVAACAIGHVVYLLIERPLLSVLRGTGSGHRCDIKVVEQPL